MEERKKDSPEELPLGDVIVLVIREVALELIVSLANTIVEVLDWGFGEVFYWTRVGVPIANVLTVRGLTYLLLWMMCFIKRTVQC